MLHAIRPALARLLVTLEYRCLMPLLARGPLHWAYRVTAWRGRLNARWGRDWTELSLGIRYIAERSARAYGSFMPDADAATLKAWVVERYQTVAREELDGAFAIAGRFDVLRCDLSQVRQALSQKPADRGLVVVMSHHDSFFVAMLAIARTGARVSLMTSDVVFDERVPAALRRFTRLKYQAFEGQMNGGRFLPTSQFAHAFFKRELARGAVLIVVTDTPASTQPDRGTCVQWLGQSRKMADGAVRIAVETHSQLLAAHVRYESPGLFSWRCSALVDPDVSEALMPAQAHREQVFKPLAAFLEQVVYRDPGRWSAAHLLEDFPPCG